MKALAIIALFGSLLAAQAHAEYYAYCGITGGSEGAISVAPKSFFVEQADGTYLTTETNANGKPSLESKAFSTEKGDLTVFDNNFSAIEITTSEEMVQGIYKLDLSPCDQRSFGSATYTWKNPFLDMIQNNGFVTYKCDCAVD